MSLSLTQGTLEDLTVDSNPKCLRRGSTRRALLRRWCRSYVMLIKVLRAITRGRLIIGRRWRARGATISHSMLNCASEKKKGTRQSMEEKRLSIVGIFTRVTQTPTTIDHGRTTVAIHENHCFSFTPFSCRKQTKQFCLCC